MTERGRFKGLFEGAGQGREDEGPEPRVVRRRNRKKTGKRDNPNYVQRTAYIRRDTERMVKHALVGETDEVGKKLEFSELVDGLLREWAEERGWGLEEDHDG